MIDTIRDIKDDLMDRKAKWLPVLVVGIVVYVLLNLWPSLALGMGIGICGTWVYRNMCNPRTNKQFQS